MRPWSRERDLEISGGSRPEIEMDFWKQGLGGDWRLVAAVQQPSLESGGSQIDVFLSEYNIFDI